MGSVRRHRRPRPAPRDVPGTETAEVRDWTDWILRHLGCDPDPDDPGPTAA